MKPNMMNAKRTLSDEEIDNLARTYAGLIHMDNEDPSPNVPTIMARIGGAIREAFNRYDELNKS